MSDDAGANGSAEERAGSPESPAANGSAEEGRSPLRRAVGRLGRGLAIGLGLLSLASAFTLVAVTQTSFGRNAAASLVARQIEKAINGTVHMGPILEGNLLTRAVVERFEIRGPDGEIFVAVDTVRLDYDPTGFLRANLRFRSLEAAYTEVRLLQGLDGSWNFQRIFGGDEDTQATPDTAAVAEVPEDRAALAADTLPPARLPGLRLLFTDARTASGLFEVRRPYEPAPATPRGRRAGAGEEGESIWRIETVTDSAGGVRYEQVLSVESMAGSFPLLRLLHPRDPLRIEMDRMTGLARAVTQPLEVRRFDGALTLGDTVRVDIAAAELGASSLAGAGWVTPGDPVEYRFDLRAEPAAFEDLQWLPVPVPASGGGPMDLVVLSRGETVVVEVADGDVDVEDSRLRGSFTIALEETPTFEALDFTMDPLRVQLIHRLLERPELVDGYLRGRLRGSGPIERLRIDGDVSLVDLGGERAVSGLRAVGGVSIVEPFTLRGLALSFDEFELLWTGVLGFSAPLSGRLNGEATLDGEPLDVLAFEGDVRHRTPEGATSRLAGRGALDVSGASVVNVDVRVDPLALDLVNPFFPNLDLVGEVRGSLRASGGLSDLQAAADLLTPRGEIQLDGRFDLEAERKRYDAAIRASGIDLSQWAGGAPETALEIRGRVTGLGTAAATLQAALDLELLPSVFEQARVDTSRVRFTLDGGTARVDTFEIRTDAGRVTGRGSFGLAGDRTGSLVLEVSADDLATWNRWVLPGIPERETLGPEAELLTDIAGPGLGGGEAPSRPAEGLAGSLTARGVLFGNLESFSFGGQVMARDIRYRDYGADSLLARLDIPTPRDLDSLVVVGTAWKAEVLGQALDSVTARLERSGEGLAQLRAHAARDTTVEVGVEAAIEWGEGRFRADLSSLLLQAGDHEVVLGQPAHIVYGDAGLEVRDLVLRGRRATIRVVGDIPATGEGEFEIGLADLDLAEVVEALPNPPDISGTASALLQIRGTLDAPRMRLSAEIRDPTVESVGHSLIEADLGYEDGVVDGEVRMREDGRLLARTTGQMRADLRLRKVERRVPDDAFGFRIEADSLSVALLTPWIGGLTEVTGYLAGTVEVTGDPAEPSYGGAIELVAGGALVPGLGVRYDSVRGAARFEGQRLRVDSLIVRAGGSGRVLGTIGLEHLRDPAFDLSLSASQLQAIDRRAMRFLVSGEGRLGGSYRSAEVTGRFRFRDGDIRQDEFLRSRQVIDLTDPDVYSLIDTTVVGERRLLARAQNPFMQNLKVDAQIDLGPNLWLRSDVLDVELEGEGIDVRMDRAAGTLVMLGTVRLPRGTYVFDRVPPYRSSLQIEEGAIDFVGTPGLDPNVEITAEYRTRTPSGPVTIWADITGTLRETQLQTRSNPPTLSESDRLCFLVVGAPCYGAGDERLGQRLVQESVLATLSSGLSSAFVGSSGLSYLQLRSVGTIDAPESTGLETSRDLFARAELAVGWYAGEDLFFSVGQPLAGGAPRVVIEWRFSEHWTLEARAENRFDKQQFGLYTASAIESEQTYGLFIFREWSFP